MTAATARPVPEAHEAARLFPGMEPEEFMRITGFCTGLLVRVHPSTAVGFWHVAVIRGAEIVTTRRPVSWSEIGHVLQSEHVDTGALIRYTEPCEPAKSSPWAQYFTARVVTERPSTSGYVYFIQSGLGGPIKIGHADDPASRLGQIQLMSPFPLRLLGTAPGGEKRERELHRRFASIRLHGEWFQATAALLELITKEVAP